VKRILPEMDRGVRKKEKRREDGKGKRQGWNRKVWERLEKRPGEEGGGVVGNDVGGGGAGSRRHRESWRGPQTVYKD